jgi:HEPN domain-containing protein
MKTETQAWVDKAEGDWRTMLRESEVLDGPTYDAVCFHAQQCAEKYLKARLVEAEIPFRKTHDLLNLLEMVKNIEPEWSIYHDPLSTLSVFGVAGRYPGLTSNQMQSDETVINCREIRSVVRTSLDLPTS